MQNNLSRSLAIAAALMVGSLIAHGQGDSTTVNLPGISGVTTYNSVPQGFDPAAASDAELEEYGFPRRPDISDKVAYARWLEAVNTTRIAPELVVHAERYHRPNHVVGKTQVGENTTNLKSGNWSGYSLVGGSPQFVEVVGIWIVPNVGTQFSKIDGFMSEWVGIDGNCTCNDLIQDGTEQQFTGGKASYYAWIEFIPEAEIEISNFPVAPGDVIYAYSAVGTRSGKTVGLYFMANYNTRKSVSTSLAIPPKTTFAGKSAEWIVERTEVNGSFNNPLPDYAYSYMDNAWAFRNGSSHTILYSTQPNENITMAQGSTSLSEAYAQDSDSMWFKWLAY